MEFIQPHIFQVHQWLHTGIINWRILYPAQRLVSNFPMYWIIYTSAVILRAKGPTGAKSKRAATKKRRRVNWNRDPRFRRFAARRVSSHALWKPWRTATPRVVRRRRRVVHPSMTAHSCVRRPWSVATRAYGHDLVGRSDKFRGISYSSFLLGGQ